jgi:hypothetical protein
MANGQQNSFMLSACLPCPCAWCTPRVVHAEHQIDHDRNEAVQPHTIAIITGFLSRVVNKAMQLFYTI